MRLAAVPAFCLAAVPTFLGNGANFAWWPVNCGWGLCQVRLAGVSICQFEVLIIKLTLHDHGLRMLTTTILSHFYTCQATQLNLKTITRAWCQSSVLRGMSELALQLCVLCRKWVFHQHNPAQNADMFTDQRRQQLQPAMYGHRPHATHRRAV